MVSAQDKSVTVFFANQADGGAAARANVFESENDVEGRSDVVAQARDAVRQPIS